MIAISFARTSTLCRESRSRPGVLDWICQTYKRSFVVLASFTSLKLNSGCRLRSSATQAALPLGPLVL